MSNKIFINKLFASCFEIYEVYILANLNIPAVVAPIGRSVIRQCIIMLIIFVETKLPQLLIAQLDDFLFFDLVNRQKCCFLVIRSVYQLHRLNIIILPAPHIQLHSFLLQYSTILFISIHCIIRRGAKVEAIFIIRKEQLPMFTHHASFYYALGIFVTYFFILRLSN